MTITVVNHQRTTPPGTRAIKSLSRELARLAQKQTPGESWLEVTLHLLDDEGIVPINRAIMGHEGPTDVITQRYDTTPGEPEGVIGELFINVERACTIRRAKGWTKQQEFALYLAHGFDHLTGADDATPSQRATMRRRELRWLKLTQDYICGLFRVRTSKT